MSRYRINVWDANGESKGSEGYKTLEEAREEFGYWRDTIRYPDFVRLIDTETGTIIKQYTGVIKYSR